MSGDLEEMERRASRRATQDFVVGLMLAVAMVACLAILFPFSLHECPLPEPERIFLRPEIEEVICWPWPEGEQDPLFDDGRLLVRVKVMRNPRDWTWYEDCVAVLAEGEP